MFSQWRHAVETLAQPPKSSQDASAEDATARTSTDSSIRTSLSSSSQLAESALSNLRKTLVSQRSGSPNPAQQAPSPPAAEPTTPVPKPRTGGRTTLEDRLRAKFAIGDASGNTTPTASARASPSPVPVADHPLTALSQDQDVPVVKGPPNPLSPTSAPLPDSPLASPTTTESPLPLHASSESVSELPNSRENPPSYSNAEAAPRIPPAQLTAAVIAPDDSSSQVDVAATAETAERMHDVSVSLPNNRPEAADATSASVAQDDTWTTPVRESSTPESQIDALPSVSEEPPLNTAVVSDQPVLLPTEPLDASEAVQDDLPVAAHGTVVNDDVHPDSAPHVEESPAANSDVPQTTGPSGHAVDVEALQKRLKLVEQRFADVSTSFKRLQAEKLAADRVLRELTSVESVMDVEALRDFLQNMNLKTEMAQDEIRRLNGKLTRQDERIEELRDIHRLESKSQVDLIDTLRAQAEEAEKLLKASQGSTSQIEQESVKRQTEIERLQSELDKATNNAKEEEEKRSKAIALLKTVRQKLVKAEKERDDALKEIGTLKETEKVEREKEKAERTKLQGEIDNVHAEREMAVQGLRAQFDKEVAHLKEKYEKESAALRGQYELEAITAKTTHVKEIDNKKARISALESTVRTLSREKDELFDQLQLRQAELESSQSTLESLQGQNTELQYQLREANDRVALLQDEFIDVRREQNMKVQSPGPSAEEVTRLLAAAESKYETKLSDLRRRLAEAERERDEGEAHWSKKLAERAREAESLQAIINSSQKNKEAETESAQALKDEIQALRSEIKSYQQQIVDLRGQLNKAVEVETAATTQLAELSTKTADIQQAVEDAKSREAQLRTQNKTLRDELRKVQSSVALLEKQRGPGVGYWASRNESTSEIKSPRSSISDLTSRETSSRPSSPATTAKYEEEVNFEYLRNVIIQFLEHKEMRPHLVRILSTILRFTPQETRRLISKV